MSEASHQAQESHHDTSRLVDRLFILRGISCTDAPLLSEGAVWPPAAGQHLLAMLIDDIASLLHGPGAMLPRVDGFGCCAVCESEGPGLKEAAGVGVVRGKHTWITCFTKHPC